MGGVVARSVIVLESGVKLVCCQGRRNEKRDDTYWTRLRQDGGAEGARPQRGPVAALEGVYFSQFLGANAV